MANRLALPPLYVILDAALLPSDPIELTKKLLDAGAQTGVGGPFLLTDLPVSVGQFLLQRLNLLAVLTHLAVKLLEVFVDLMRVVTTHHPRELAAKHQPLRVQGTLEVRTERNLFDPCPGGSTGKKVFLSVAYERDEPGLHREPSPTVAGWPTGTEG